MIRLLLARFLAVCVILLPVKVISDINVPLCESCHSEQTESYQRSKMAIAAQTVTFINEWNQKGQPDRCFNCHSPSLTQGVVCTDCHQGANHPFNLATDINICSRCHDAPGEITLRSYYQSPSSRKGERCSACHLNIKVSGHEFLGPSTPGFLKGVARLDIALRIEGDDTIAIVSINHNAGHAVPGGTTGRSVWLLADQFNDAGEVMRLSETRFGWQDHQQQGWKDNTLPAGCSTVVEIPVDSDPKLDKLRVKLIYRFEPGLLQSKDTKQFTLDELIYQLEGRGASR